MVACTCVKRDTHEEGRHKVAIAKNAPREDADVFPGGSEGAIDHRAAFSPDIPASAGWHLSCYCSILQHACTMELVASAAHP